MSKRQRSSKPQKPALKRQRTASVGRTFVQPRSMGEMKYFDCENPNIALAATTTTWVAGTMQDPTTTINLGDAAIGTPLNLCSPIVSANLNGRIGRKIRVQKIKLSGFINIPPQATQGAADTSTEVRIALVQDTQTNTAQMTGAQLFNDAGTANATIHSFQNPNNFGRFRVLKEKILVMTNANLTGSPTAADVIQSGLLKTFKFNHEFKKPVIVNFNATGGGTVTSIIDNSFHVVAAVNNASYAPTLTYYSRVGYKDV